jgi:hypothetical protein
LRLSGTASTVVVDVTDEPAVGETYAVVRE